MNHSTRAIILKAFPQPVDIDLDGVRSDITRKAEYLILDGALRHNPAAPLHRNFRKRQRPGGKYLRLAADENLTRCRVENKIAKLERAPKQLSGPAEQRFKPRHELLDGKGLHKIVVGPGAQACDPVV